jgi:hypothetical protein
MAGFPKEDFREDGDLAGLSRSSFFRSNRRIVKPSQKEPAVANPANQVPIASTMFQSMTSVWQMRRWSEVGPNHRYPWPVPIWKTSEEAAAHMHTVSNKQVAFIALLGVLVSAALSFGSAEMASRRSAQSASETIKQQMNGETDRSKAEFLRGQRQVLYSKIIADEREIWEAEQAALYARNSGEEPKSLDKALNTMRSAFAADLASAEIIASPTVRSHVTELYYIHWEALDHLGAPLLHYELRLVRDDMPAMAEINSKRRLALKAFYETARKDMGSE